MNNKRTFFVLLLVGLLAMCFSSVTAAEKPKKIIVACVKNTSDYKTIKPLIAKWSEKTGVEVEIIEEDTTTYVSSYVLAGRTGKPKLDVVAIWDFYIDQLYPMLIPLDGSYDSNISLSPKDKEDFLDIGLTEYKGHPYLLPYSLDTRLLYYRTDLLEKAGFTRPPETWKELVEYAQALTKDLDGDGNIDQWGFASICAPGQVYNTYTFFDFLFQGLGGIFDEKDKPIFNSSEGVKALQFMVDLRNKYKVMPPDVITYTNNEVHTGFLAGKFAMVNHWPYLFGMVKGSNVEGKVGYSKEAYCEGGKSVSVFNKWAFGIPKISEHKLTAWDLISYLTSTEAGIFEFSEQKDWPLRKSVYSAAEVQRLVPDSHREFSEVVFRIAREFSKPVLLPRAGEVSQIMADHIDKGMVGKTSPQETLDAAVAEISKLLR